MTSTYVATQNTLIHLWQLPGCQPLIGFFSPIERFQTTEYGRLGAAHLGVHVLDLDRGIDIARYLFLAFDNEHRTSILAAEHRRQLGLVRIEQARLEDLQQAQGDSEQERVAFQKEHIEYSGGQVKRQESHLE